MADRDQFIDEGLQAFAENPENRDRAILQLIWQQNQLMEALGPLLQMVANPTLMKQAEKAAGMFGGMFGGR